MIVTNSFAPDKFSLSDYQSSKSGIITSTVHMKICDVFFHASHVMTQHITKVVLSHNLLTKLYINHGGDFELMIISPYVPRIITQNFKPKLEEIVVYIFSLEYNHAAKHPGLHGYNGNGSRVRSRSFLLTSGASCW